MELVDGERRGISSRDLNAIAGQLGRPPRDITGVAVRCPFDYPAVIESAPVLGGAPNPTLLHLTCPTMVTTVSRLESSGSVREFRAWIQTNDEARRTLEEISGWYKLRRAFLAEGQSTGILPDGGVGGPEGPDRASCLHAYAAALLAVASGWLRGETGANSECIDSSERIWARFFPPVAEIWCGDGICGRFEDT